MVTNITELRDIAAGDDVYVVGAGPSLDFIDKSFFDGKFVICVNSVCKLMDVSYTVTKDQWVLDELLEDGYDRLIVSKHNFGNYAQPKITGGDYVFNHPDGQPIYRSLRADDLRKVDLDNDHICIGDNTFCSTMHIAAYMGAKNIILVANDGGSIDGRFYATGYPVHSMGASKRAVKHWNSNTALVRDWLVEVYGVNIYSLNPFINLGLEGHKYEAC